jgi:hypothetical protein
MSWYDSSWKHMQQVHQQEVATGKDAAEIAKAIDDAYPFWSRNGWPYKAWLRARREFLIKHQLPVPRARKPKDDLFTTACAHPPSAP